jgi:hypothetical protein
MPPQYSSLLMNSSRYAQFDLVHPGLLDVAARTDELGAGALADADLGVLLAAFVDNGHHRAMVSTLFTTVGAIVKAFHRREGRLDARVATLALQAFQQRRLLPADVGPRTHVHVYVQVETAAQDVLAEPPCGTGLGDGPLQDAAT